ncbi:phosphoribosylformylglycinamidine synthase subunit PurQ [Acidobacteriia bacterium AH_259_A11_L15]|nr:phosphoribosylformylglycinamidine synthase subunit PurQ [Acidobacteriia bacterium AH_259_A11_L15]
MKFGVVVFPGSNCDHDAFHVLHDVLGQPAEWIWHESTDIIGLDAVILPGGFAYGDYLRTGAIASHSPVMGAVKKFAARGGLVLGICNGFQILLEAGLLPGAMLRNRRLKFLCRFVHLRVEATDTPFSSACQMGQVLKFPIAHMEGNYFAEPATLKELEANHQVVFRYATPGGEVVDDEETNPNGALDNIAGITNRERNVLGLMPHPERASEPLLGSTDGLALFRSLVDSLVAR